MNITRIYSGDNLFDKFPEFSGSISVYSKIISKSLNSSEKSSDNVIDEIFLGWSFNLYRCGHRYFVAGFPKFESNVIEILASEQSKNVHVACNANKFYVIANNGKLFVYLRGNLIPNIYDLSKENFDIKHLAADDIYTVILNNDGTVFLLNVQEEISITKFHLPHKIIEVVCGKEHVLFLTKSGQVYSFGNGSRGQLGHGNIFNNDSPELIEALDGVKIKSIACGGWHSAAISYSNDLYMWGWNESGQLGFPSTEQFDNAISSKNIEVVCCLPKVVEFEEEKQIMSVSCGSRHTAVLTEDNQIWTWGWNGYGQLGCDKFKFCDKPYRVSLPSGFVPEQIKCAFWSTLITGTLTT